MGVPFYLSCPIDSHHATYEWRHGDHRSPCQQMGSNCLHLIPALKPSSYGRHQCFSQERNHTKLVAEYQLTVPMDNRSENNRNRAAAPVWRVDRVVLSAATVVVVARLGY